MHIRTATVTITGISPLSQSHPQPEAKLPGENHDAFDERTWRSKLNTSAAGTIIIPPHGMHQAIAAAAKYSGKQIPGQGKKTWTAKFTTGLAFLDEIDTGIPADAAQCIVISANADGVRGSGKRVTRRFPIVYQWSSTFDVTVLDPIITDAVFAEMLEIAGMFIGVGRFRPEKGGQNGRFKIDAIEWSDGRKMAA